MHSKLWLSLLTLTALGVPTTATAHMIETNYLLPSPAATSTVTTHDAERSALQIKAVFSTGEPYANAKVEIFAPGNDQQPWLETTTNDQGEYQFIPDGSQPGEWTINIGEDSHWDSLTVPVQTTGDRIRYGDISDASSDRPTNIAIIGAVVMLGSLGYASMRMAQHRQ